MKILITGGAGFIASHIADAYIKLGHKVIVIDNLSTGRREFVNKKARFYKADIRARVEIERIIQSEQPEIINHHAAQISVRASVNDPLFDAQVNILGLLNLLEVGRKAKVAKIIFASSGGAIYGETNILPTPENFRPLQPLSPYGISKLTSEYYLNFYYQVYKIPYIALRYSNVYGPRQNPHGEAGVVAIFTRKLLHRETPTINGDGKQTRDYVYVGDVVEANKKALATSSFGAFNVGTGVETNVVELYESLKEIMKVDIKAKYDSARSGEQKRSCLDAKLAKKELGWQAKINFSEGLEKTVKYFRTHE